MHRSKALSFSLMAAFLIAAPALAEAKQAQKAQAAKTAQKQKAGKDCVTTAPPFMRNPRFMNRGFFKKKCKTK